MVGVGRLLVDVLTATCQGAAGTGLPAGWFLSLLACCAALSANTDCTWLAPYRTPKQQGSYGGRWYFKHTNANLWISNSLLALQNAASRYGNEFDK